MNNNRRAQVRCSECNGYNHNKRTCPVILSRGGANLRENQATTQTGRFRTGSSQASSKAHAEDSSDPDNADSENVSEGVEFDADGIASDEESDTPNQFVWTDCPVQEQNEGQTRFKSFNRERFPTNPMRKRPGAINIPKIPIKNVISSNFCGMKKFMTCSSKIQISMEMRMNQGPGNQLQFLKCENI